MEILNEFGFDIKLFVAQIVNFLVIAYLFKRFLYKPILDTLDKRNRAIAKGVKDAELATKALEDAESEKDEILKKAGKEAEKILEEAKAQAELMRDETMQQTKKDIERMMQQTNDQIVLERENFKKEARDLSLELSRQILQNTIVGLFDKKDNEKLVAKSIGKISAKS